MRHPWIWLLLYSLALTRVAHAQLVTAQDARSYEEAIRHAVEEYSLGHWAEAKVFFLRAHAVHPTARTLRGLGLASYESRSYVEAIAYLKAALASPVQPLTESMRADLTRLLAQAQQFVTHAIVELSPPTATLAVDQVTRRPGAHGEILLDPGEHQLSASAPGYTPQRRNVNATGGRVYVQLELAREPSLPLSAAGEALQREPAPAESGPSLGAYVLIGSSAAVAIAGGVMLGVAFADKAAVEHASSAWPQLESRYDRGRTFFPLGYSLASAGLCGVAAGLTWQLWPRGQERAQLGVSPGGLMLRGRF